MHLHCSCKTQVKRLLFAYENWDTKHASFLFLICTYNYLENIQTNIWCSNIYKCVKYICNYIIYTTIY